VHLSRYSIFSGPKSTSYLPSDTPEPASLYEASKLEGERWLVGLAADHRLMIRTPWVYSANGRDFVKNAPDLFEQPSTLDVIADRIGTPTRMRGVAEAFWELARNGAYAVCTIGRGRGELA